MWFKRLYSTLLLVIVTCTLVAQSENKWTHLGPFTTPNSSVAVGQMSSTGMGWIESLWVSEDQQTIYAGSITSGLYKSIDGGKSWNISKFPSIQYGVFDILVNKKEVFVATGLTHYDEEFGIGLLKSNEQADQWDTTGLNFKLVDKTVLWSVASITSECMLAASPSKIYKSEDNGKSWIPTLAEQNKNFDFRQVVVSKYKSKVCFASGNQLFKSTDAGDSWENISSRLSVFQTDEASKVKLQRIAICLDPNQKKRILALYSYAGYTIVDESTDGGKNWTLLYRHRKIQRIDINHAEIAIAPGNSNYILIGGVRAYLSTNGGQDFNQITFPNYGTPQFVHDDIRAVIMIDSLTYYLGTDGGIVKTSDAGKSWQSLNGYGLTAMMIYGIGLVNEGFMVGCQDLGSFSYQNGEWTNIGRLYGDGGDALQVDGKVYSMLGGNLRVMSSSDYSSIRYRTPDLSMRTFTAKFVAYPDSKDSLFLVSDHLWFFDGEKWTNKTSSLKNNGYKATAVDINKSNKSQLFFAFDQPTWGNDKFSNKFWKSVDGGTNWINLTDSLEILKWRFISSISTNPVDEDQVFLSLGIMDSDTNNIHKVYKSMNGGLSWTNWSEGLPPYESFKITFIEGSKSGLLYSCVAGLYYRNEVLNEWIKLSNELPAVAIRDFEIDYMKGIVYVATYGNGVWQLTLNQEQLTR